MPQLPVTDPVLIVAIALLIFLTSPVLARQARLPGIIGVILAGTLVGPNALNLLARDQTVVLLGTVGLLYLIFLAGIEIDLQGFKRYRNRSLGFGALSFLLPQLVGAAVGLALGYPPAAAILLGSMFGSHTLIAYPVAIRFGIAKNRAITTAVGGTIVTDTTALLVLAVVAASTRGALDGPFWLTLGTSLTVYALAVWYGLPRLGSWFFRKQQVGPVGEYTFVLTALFGGAYLAYVAGVQPIVGAFLVGLALNRLIPEGSALVHRLHFFGEAFFIPFFLLSVGMLVDVRVILASPRVWLVMSAMVGTVLLTKGGAALLAGRLFGYTRQESWTMLGLTVPQAAATLAATLIGVEVGLFDEAILNGAVMMILVTCIVGPWVVGRFGRVVALADEQRPLETADLPQRILVPMANPATARALLDLALYIREPNSHEALYPLTVVPGEVGRSAQHVALAEKMLAEATSYVSASDVRVIPVTRVDHNFAKGIVRGIEETRTTTAIVGWDGRPSVRRGIFGSVLDQILEQTRQEILVAKLGHPLNTTERVIVLVPAGSDHLPGFFESVRSIKLLANRLSATLDGITVGTDEARYERHFEAVKPTVPTAFREAASWSDALRALAGEVAGNDLVIVLGSRRDGVSWQPALDRLPGDLAVLLPQSFVMIYPAELAAPAAMALPATPRPMIMPQRVVFAAPPKLREAIDAVLALEFDAEKARRIRRLLTRDWPRALTELRDGAAVVHASVRELTEPITFLACSPDGIDVPHAAGPVRLLFVLLSTGMESDEHLRHLAEIASLVGDPLRLEQMLAAGSQHELVDALPRW